MRQELTVCACAKKFLYLDISKSNCPRMATYIAHTVYIHTHTELETEVRMKTINVQHCCAEAPATNKRNANEHRCRLLIFLSECKFLFFPLPFLYPNPSFVDKCQTDPQITGS